MKEEKKEDESILGCSFDALALYFPTLLPSALQLFQCECC